MLYCASPVQGSLAGSQASSRLQDPHDSSALVEGVRHLSVHVAFNYWGRCNAAAFSELEACTLAQVDSYYAAPSPFVTAASASKAVQLKEGKPVSVSQHVTVSFTRVHARVFECARETMHEVVARHASRLDPSQATAIISLVWALLMCSIFGSADHVHVWYAQL
jgi:hypothetical protein